MISSGSMLDVLSFSIGLVILLYPLDPGLYTYLDFLDPWTSPESQRLSAAVENFKEDILLQLGS